jgi:hypothetical protein
MASTSRVSLPSEFYDRTSDELLIQPQPQFLYAQMWLGAMGASLAVPGELGIAGRGVSGNGAPYAGFERGQLMLANPMITQVIAAKVDFNGAPGNTIRINRPAYNATTYTEASRLIPTSASISTTAVAPKGEQTNLTLFRYGGPYDSANSRVAPYAIESFDANMGVHKLSQVVGDSLKQDCHKFIDAVQVTLLDLASSALYPEGMTAVDDATAAGMFPFTYELLSRAEQTADDANLPVFPDGYRAFVGTPTQLKQLKDDPQFQRYAEKHPEYNALFPQYLGSVGKTHVFKSTTLTVTANSSTVNVHKGHYIAPGALLGGMGRPLRVASSTDDNFGETAKVVWLGDLAFGLADNRFVISVRSSE